MQKIESKFVAFFGEVRSDTEGAREKHLREIFMRFDSSITQTSPLATADIDSNSASQLTYILPPALVGHLVLYDRKKGELEIDSKASDAA